MTRSIAPLAMVLGLAVSSTPVALAQEFRTIDGTGNSLASPSMGSAETPLVRGVPSDYSDGISGPAGANRPSARLISNLLCSQTTPMPNGADASDYLWQWGQFLDHDIDLTGPADPGEPFDIPVPRGDRFFELIDALDDAIVDLVDLEVGLGHQIAKDRDRPQQILVVGSAAAALVGPEMQHGGVDDAVHVTVLMLDAIDFGSVTLDEDLVAFSATEVPDHIVADAVDPVVMDIVILTGHAIHAPFDRAIVVDMLEDDVTLGVDQGAEVEGVRASASDHHVIAFDGLIGVVCAGGVVDLVVGIIAAVVVLGDHRFSAVGIADQQVIAVTTFQAILAMTSAEHIVHGGA